VDFWATWCGPCLASLPLLAEVQQRHGSALEAIALTTIDEHNSIDRIQRVSSQRAEQWGVPAGVRIAVDDGERTSRAFRIAMRDTALPRTVIIDQGGRIAWWGHPADAAPVIDSVIAGTWDLAAERERFDAVTADGAASRAIVDRYLIANRSDDLAAQLALAEEACAFPVANSMGMSPLWWAWTTRVSILARLGRTDEARLVAIQAAITDGIRDEPSALGDLVAAIPDSEVQLRQELAERAVARVEYLESTPPRNSWDTFLRDAQYTPFGYVFAQAADAFAKAGQHARAADLLRRAIERAPEDRRFIGNKAELGNRLKALETAAP